MVAPGQQRERHALDGLHPDNPRASSALEQIRAPLSVRRLAIVIVILLPIVALALLLVPWQQSASATGQVIAWAPTERQQRLEAPLKGRVHAVLVQEGQRVHAGQPLIELRDNDPTLMDRLRQQREAAVADRDAAREQIRSYESKLAADEIARERLDAELTAEIQGTLQKRVGEAAELEVARLNRERIEILAAEGIESTRSLELARGSVQKANAALDALDRTIAAKRQAQQKALASASSKIASTRAELEAARGKLANAEQKLVDIEVKLSRQATQIVTAPRNGSVLRIDAVPGEQVKSGDPLLSLVPLQGGAAVELWVDGNDMPFVDPGEDTRLVFEGWPALQFVGLPGAARGTWGGRVALIDATDDGTGKFRVVVVPTEPWPDQLRQGVRAKGFILLGDVSLGYELWRQVNGFPPVPSVEKGDTSLLPSQKKPRIPTKLK